MRKILFSNGWLKLLALVFATALWFLIVGEKGTEIGFLIPLELRGVAKDMMVANHPPREIEVRVTGPRTLLSNMSPGEISAAIDLTNAHQGINRFTLMPEDIKTPRGISVLRLSPSFVKVTLESLLTIKLPVSVRLTGRFPSGFIVRKLKVEPSSIEVIGARSKLKGMRSVGTVPIDVADITGSRMFESVAIDIPDSGVTKVSPSEVSVTVIVGKHTVKTDPPI